MATITIGVINPSETEKVTMQVPDDVDVLDLQEAIVEQMGLPLRGSNGERLRYHLGVLKEEGILERLDDKATLVENEVHGNDVLQLTVEMVAGCFLPGTTVTLPDGKYISIENLKAGDKVLSYDTHKKQLCEGVVSEVYIGETYEYLVINDELFITGSHLVFCNDHWIQAKNLLIGDTLVTEDGTSVSIKTIRHRYSPTTIYNLHLRTLTHTFFAEKVLVHNMTQKMLPSDLGQDDEVQTLEKRAQEAIKNNNRGEAIRLLRQAREAYDRIRTSLGEITTSELNPAYAEVFEKLRDLKMREGVHSEIAAPIIQGDKVIGVLQLNYATPRQFTDNEFNTVESLANQVATALPVYEKLSNEAFAFKSFTLTGKNSKKLTPEFLATELAPYLTALSDLQNVINNVLKQQPHQIRIRMIAQNSPVSVSLDGAAEAVQAVQDSIVPWRRKHAEKMAYLLEQEKLTEIEIKRADILEKRANAAKSRAEAEKLTTDVAKQREEIETMKLENERLRLELSRNKIQLALDILNQLSPQLSETERIAYIVKLLPPLDIVIFSNLEVMNPRATG